MAIRDILELSATDPNPDLRIEPGVSSIPASELGLQGPDRSLLLVESGLLRARLSCWWSETPELDGQRIGVIGHYAASDAASGQQLLDAACALLRQHGRQLAVGPMDGNTWRRYRFVVERGSEPPFALEPTNPDEWPEHWTAAGFATLATYASALNEKLDALDSRTDQALSRLADEGVTITPFDLAKVDVTLERLYELSLRAFGDNFLYTPIGREEFLAQYQAVLPHVRPDLVLLAERSGDLVGYMFALPDMLQRMRGEPVDTVILKTLAVDTSARGIGLGGALLDLAQRTAHTLGYRRAIHALFHEANVSGRISGRYARPIRKYALFSRALTA
jgi:GNAT superfamily N-acetyltransferase